MELPKVEDKEVDEKVDETSKEGNENKLVLSPRIIFELDRVKPRVMRYEWDYVAVIAGLPGTGKSTFARGLAKYCCPWFSIDDIVFTADDFIKRTSECPEYSAVVYDECFEGMNSRVTLSPDFRRIVNHLQLLRKRHLFIFLCLPNFFDLSKTLAVFRTSHLFVTYATEEGRRGRVMAFSREAKRNLFIQGQKFMNYGAVRSNFQTTFGKNAWIINEDEYEKKKDATLLARARELEAKGKSKVSGAEKRTARIMVSLLEHGYSRTRVAELMSMTPDNVRMTLKHYRDKGLIDSNDRLIDKAMTDDLNDSEKEWKGLIID